MNGRKYDIIIYGATGFTGQYVVEEVVQVAKLEKESNESIPVLRWAIAGRNEEKLKKCITVAEEEHKISLKDIDILIVNNDDQESIESMVSQTNCIINCVGPYYKYGEPVVKACIEKGTSHVDISGEFQFLEGMELKYNKAAEDAEVYIVGSCGVDSVPADIGLCHMIRNFQGRLNSVSLYLKINSPRGNSIHTGTMESAALVVANYKEIQEIRNKLHPDTLPTPKYSQERCSIHKVSELNGWGLRLPGDEPTVERTQRYLYKKEGRIPIQFRGFIYIPYFAFAIGALFGIFYFVAMTFFSFTRHFLVKYPEIFTAGFFTKEGPKRETLKKVKFSSTLVAKAWSHKLEEESDQYAYPPDTTLILKVSGPDPGYQATSIMLVACAMTIIRERENCTGRGGVMTPGIAFMNTNIVNRMIKRGVTFDLTDPTKEDRSGN